MEIEGQISASEHLKKAWEGISGFVKDNLGAIVLGAIGLSVMGVDLVPFHYKVEGPYNDETGEPIFNDPDDSSDE